MKLETNERKNKLVYILLGICVVFLIFLAYFNLTGPIAMKKYDVYYEVSTNVGFDLNSTVIKFGRVIPASESSKELNVLNTYNFPIEVKISTDKNLKGLIYMREKVVIGPGEQKPFLIYLYVPSDYPYGNYTGEISVNFYKI